MTRRFAAGGPRRATPAWGTGPGLARHSAQITEYVLVTSALARHAGACRASRYGAASGEIRSVTPRSGPWSRACDRSGALELLALRDAGIRQFLDIGTGLPTRPNTHETAQEGHPDARVVYVDNDPVVVVHAEALMTDNATTAVVRADLRDVDEVLAKAGQLLDFTRPVALMFVAVLHCVPDEDDPAAIAARYLAALAPGSYLVLSHSTDEFAPDRTHQASAEAKERGATWIPRSKDSILRMFNGRELLDPGCVLVSRWRPDADVPAHNADRAWSYCGVALI